MSNLGTYGRVPKRLHNGDASDPVTTREKRRRTDGELSNGRAEYACVRRTDEVRTGSFERGRASRNDRQEAVVCSSWNYNRSYHHHVSRKPRDGVGCGFDNGSSRDRHNTTQYSEESSFQGEDDRYLSLSHYHVRSMDQRQQWTQKEHRNHHNSDRKSRSRRPRDRSVSTDETGRAKVKLGVILDHRYEIVKEIGQGTFCNVYEGYDLKRQRRVAMKFVKAVDRYIEAGGMEMDVLRRLDNGDPEYEEKSKCVVLLNDFMISGHLCMVFTLHGSSLYDVMRRTSSTPFHPHLVKDIIKQMLQAVAYLRRKHIIHTDLKPENVLFDDPNVKIAQFPLYRYGGYAAMSPHAIRLADLGGATVSWKHHSRVIQTRPYRAPEVVLGIGWHYPADVWSVGCILMELITGRVMLDARYNVEHLAMMEKAFGKFPSEIATKSPKYDRFFDKKGFVRWPEMCRDGDTRYVEGVFPLEDTSEVCVDDNLLSLLRRMMAINPDDRITAEEALRTPYFQ